MFSLFCTDTNRLANYSRSFLLLFQVNELSELSRDQLVCVSPSKQFLVPKDSRMLVEIKANWGRARKQYGPNATDLVITANKNPQIDVSLLTVTLFRSLSMTLPGVLSLWES